MIKRPKLRNLKQEELKILMEFQENPFITFEELAQKTKISKSVVFRTIKKFEDPSLKPAYLTIVAIPNLRALNFENFEVFVEAEQTHQIKSIITLCEEHPYIWYYARCYGKINGFSIQYRTPKGTRHQIQELLDILKTKNLIQNYYVLNFEENVIYTHPQVKNWDMETLSWNFDWNEWFLKKIEKIPIQQQQKNREKRLLTNLKQIDLLILKELLRNSRRKNIEMIQCMKTNGWEISQQQFSKKANYLKEVFILDYRAEIHPETLDILTPVLLWGRGEQEEILKLAVKIKHFPIPFISTFKYNKTLVYWYLHLSTFQLAELLLNLRPILSEIHFFFIDFPHSEKFSLETSNFNENQHDWIQTDQFIIYDVLEKILKSR
ncbi:winged helix-turn-helix transcriptional regulator [Candidatus Lokiarchaeum ossiferum]|uniref:winged helix-turn-helix transcriptional regulator n=1 Tax=Candidatus Lokiarchaeum ossiferum TaxID=2951803 RepID=UPI00352F5497